MDNIIERIQKLLNLANSPNENEATLATAKANELLTKYNLNLQEIKDKDFTYTTHDLVACGLTFKTHHRMIVDIMNRYFFVAVIFSSKFTGEYSSGENSYYRPARRQKAKTIKLVGMPENCKIAAYVFDYLNALYPKLWIEYRKVNNVSPKARLSYYEGLTIGIMEKLKEARWKVQNETGLVVVKDMNLEKRVNEITNGVYRPPQNDLNTQVVKDGIADGLKVTLRKPIETSRTSESTTKQIKGS